ncbi:kielin/chordin-like protein isoform X2 [Cimex lectularius]|uniref:VWFC domain-containing protein n=1 Tax=Cimex lectularius TaxID=79782 RepID=A0A8I6SQA7_CIMLE|nr:kielin/chordin-like protein isoform X2 [Cimex lectularius]
MLEKILLCFALLGSCYGFSRTAEILTGHAQGNESDSNNIKKMVRFYKDLNCIEDQNGKFDCSLITKLKQDRCYEGGKEYPKGYKLKVSAHRFRNCICTEEDGRNRTKWMCDYQMCFGKAKDCRNLYNGSCCPISTSFDSLLKNDDKTCIHIGEKYIYGEHFIPKHDPCTVCYCDENFRGNLTEPACLPVQCNTNLLYSNYISRGCTPIFLRPQACCPSQLWLCDGEQTGRKGDKCRFGGNEYEIGEKFKPGGEVSQCVECLCRVPPYPTCVHREKCGFSNFWNMLYNAKHNFPAIF